ncbi:hypothetical protein CHLNCDRAFT_134092 [Chlorella variabilis]|uniref:Thioredoxin domain-containing protein n=1 Tax=Chlorella variabilis TaxID=554065 RepID=E1ZEZ7_CHLVA|nr:hypothetical protein CHLNCDRAFT_134092 [Chlorella variabilis]EFN55749.1 hypothetical protein CHLNCDRAFT_134092 [Chlorella variabilis]|eukprot:XP_005847851.1 hypothetical protein CHLNCDRAFT_134092 [Chlorella variabilis]
MQSHQNGCQDGSLHTAIQQHSALTRGAGLRLSTPPHRVARRCLAQPCRAFLKPNSAWWKAPKPANCRQVDSVQQLVDELEENQERLVVVEFYASWCTGCRSLFPKLLALAEETPSVRFLLVDADDNKAMARKLGVDGLPTVLLFAGPEGRVEQFNVTSSRFQTLRAAIDRWNAPRCSLAHVPPLPGFDGVRPRSLQADKPRTRAIA